MRLSPGPMIVLLLGVFGIGYALYHAATGDQRCAARCETEGHADSRYTAPMSGAQSKCHCVAEDGSLIPLP